MQFTKGERRKEKGHGRILTLRVSPSYLNLLAAREHIREYTLPAAPASTPMAAFAEPVIPRLDTASNNVSRTQGCGSHQAQNLPLLNTYHVCPSSLLTHLIPISLHLEGILLRYLIIPQPFIVICTALLDLPIAFAGSCRPHVVTCPNTVAICGPWLHSGLWN